MEKTLNFSNTLLPSPTGSLDTYISHIMSIPPLTTEEEVALGRNLQSTNDLESAKKLIMHNLRYVIYIAKSYSGYGLNLNDLVQEGNIGLMKAVKKYDPEKNLKLITFAVYWIKSEIHEFVIKNWKIVKVATTKSQRKLFFNLRSKKSTLSTLSNKEAISIAQDLGVPLKDVIEMEKRMNNHDLAIEDNDDENASPSLFLTSSELEPDQVLENEEKNLLNTKLYEVINKLDERSKDIVKSRWLSTSKLTLEDLSKKYGVSRERIRQIENESMLKLKESF
ncbi:MAG: RNA polymerase sigma factor RpoH [Gammaproteobacteria bacterium]|jgi:RNA polymerase sigma-32 factor|nr:RNA polymerase sigma factor RpoH [Gammaproteobacteria bacterium]MBT6755630.1 RNA polymerase sigma factor RpoH [Gammaproteobacteria bacterium]MBT7815052.1 RNA polymerase sigma factor RpoH [Gammaproteobacteria bacterium]